MAATWVFRAGTPGTILAELTEVTLLQVAHTMTVRGATGAISATGTFTTRMGATWAINDKLVFAISL